MLQAKQRNREQFDMFCLTVSEAFSGMCLLQTYQTSYQKEIVDALRSRVSRKWLIVDFAELEKPQHMFEMSDFRKWFNQSPDAEVIFILNLQLGGVWFGDVEFIERLNYMRDQLIEADKFIVWGMSPYFRVLFSRYARDFYTMFVHSFYFEAEEESENETKTLIEYSALSSDVRLNIERYHEYCQRIQNWEKDNGQEQMKDKEKLILETLTIWYNIREYLQAGQEDWVNDAATRYYKENMDLEWKIEKKELYSVEFFTLVKLQRVQEAIEWGLKLCRLYEKYKAYPEKLICVEHQLSLLYHEKGDIHKTTYYNNKAYAAVQLYEKMDDELLGILTMKALLCRLNGDNQKALDIYESVIARLKETEYAREKIIVYNNIAKVYMDMEQYSQSLQYFIKAEELKDKEGDIYWDITLLGNKGVLYQKLGDLKAAKSTLIKAKKMCEKAVGAESSQMATICNNLAQVYGELEVYGKQGEYLEKAMKIREKILGMDHVVTANSYYSYALFIAYNPDKDKTLMEAFQYNERALQIREKVYGKVHEQTIYCYQLKGYILYLNGMEKESASWMKRALKYYEILQGKNGPGTRQVLEEMGIMYGTNSIVV